MPPAINVAVTATLTLAAACLRTVGKTNEAELLSKKEAMKFPLIGSVSLLGLFLAIKFLPGHWLNYIMTFYFSMMGTLAIGELLFSTFYKVIPQSLRDFYVIDLRQVSIPVLIPEPEDIRINAARLLTNTAGLGFSLWYAVTKHFLANNGMGLAYSIEGIAMLNLGSTQVGLILLWGLFFYDIFWVFFTPVMVTVAKNIEGPIKLLFPVSMEWSNFNMLGLGDIVIPGLFVSLMLRYDTMHGSGKKVYFYSAMVGYTLGLIVTLVVMYAFKAAQPALLYIVPGIAGAVFAQAVYRGEVKQLWNFSDEESSGDDPAADDAPSIDPVTPKKDQ